MCAPGEQRKKKKKKQLGSSERLILIRKWVSWLQIIPTEAVCEGGGTGYYVSGSDWKIN